MFFKRIFLAFILTLLSGCSELRIGDVYESPPLQGMGMSCMNQLDEQLNQYIRQEVPMNEIGSFSRCLQTSLVAFKNHVWGEDRETYTPEELREFIQKFFLTDRVIEDKTVQQLMSLKTKFTEGTETQFTHQEIDQTIILIQTFETFMSSIYPYNTVFFGDEIPSPEKFEEGLNVLGQGLQQLLSTTFKQSYSLDELPILYQEIYVLINGTSPDEIPTFIKILKPFASFIFKDSSKTHISPQEWTRFINGLLDVYSIWMYVQFASKSPFTEKVDYYSKSAEKSITLLKNRIHSSEYNLSIPQESIFDLMNQLYEQELIPKRVRRSSLHLAIQSFLGRILTAGEEASFEITLEDVDWLESEYLRWQSIQNVLRKVHPEQYLHPPQGIQISELKTLPLDVQMDFYSLFEFKTLFNEAVDSDLNTYLTYEGYLPPAGYKNLSMRSFNLSLIRAIGRGYARQYSEGITSPELVEFLTQIYSLTQDLTIEDSTHPPSSTAFTAAHLVTYSTQGFYKDTFVEEGHERIELIEPKEGIEYLTFVQLLMNSVETVYFELQELCQQEQMTPACFKSHILKTFEKLQNSMPHLVHFVSLLNEEEQTDYTNTLLELALLGETEEASKQLNDYPMRPIHITNLVYGLIFQETTFTRFDVNQDFILDSKELDSAYPLYEGIILDALKASGRQGYSQAGYQYTVTYLSLPSDHFWTNLQMFLRRHHVYVPAYLEKSKMDRFDFLKLTSKLMSQTL